jgi:hypothetical protein
VNANHMDAVAVLYMAKWLVAELVRVFHAVDTVTAVQVVDALVERELPVIWQVGGLKRVLQPKLSMKDKMLLLLYSEPGPVPEERVISWIEHSNPTVFRRDVVRPAHRSRLIEYDEGARTLELSPVGTRWVEEHLPLALT